MKLQNVWRGSDMGKSYVDILEKQILELEKRKAENDWEIVELKRQLQKIKTGMHEDVTSDQQLLKG